MKTFVVLAGLMVIVPRTDDLGRWRELKVLVLDFEAAASRLDGESHEDVVKVTRFGGSHLDLKGAWTAESTAREPMEVVGDERFLFLSRMFGDVPVARVKQDCYGEEFRTACKDDNGRSLVKAVLTFTGGWRIRPVEITHDREPRALLYDDSIWGYAKGPMGHLPLTPPTGEVQLSSGLMLEALENAEVRFQGPSGGELDSDLDKEFGELRPEVCQLFAGYAGPCSVVRFLNTIHTPRFGRGSEPMFEAAQDAMYDLLEGKPNPRYLTYLRGNGRPEVMDILYPGGGGTPHPRPCPPQAFAEAVRMTP